MNPPERVFDSEQLRVVDNAIHALVGVCSAVCLDNDASGGDFVHCVECPLYHSLHIFRRFLE